MRLLDRWRAPHDSRSLTRSLTVACLVTLWISALPLLLSLPAPLVAVVWLLPGGAGALSVFRRLSGSVRLALLSATVLAVWGAEAGDGDFKGLAIGALVTGILMKGTEIRTARDGYSVVGFALLGPFLAFVLNIGGLWTVGCAAVTLTLALSLAGAMAEWQDFLPVRPWRQHALGVAILAAMAAPVAAAGFWVIPRLDSPLWGIPSDGPPKTGIDNRMAPGEIGALLEDDSTAFRVDFEGPRPAQHEMYWRGLTLGTFDGRTWTEQPLRPESSQGPQLTVGTSDAVRWRYSVSIEPTRQSYLFTLEHLISPTPEGAVRLNDARLAARTPLTRFSRWRNLVSTPQAQLDLTDLTTAERALMVQLPPGFNPRTQALAQRWRRQGLSDTQIIEAALDLFHREFSYSLEPPPLGRNSVDEFLFETRVGFCEHFSSSFAVLMRAAGIPSRVVIGYQGGFPNGLGDYWRVRQADAHAWNEVWLAGRGWVRVDPTAALRAERPLAPGQQTSLFRAFGTNGTVFDWVRHGWGALFEDFDAERQRDFLRMAGLEGLSPLAVGAIALGVVLALFWTTFLVVLRERREREPAELRAWRGVVRRLNRGGYSVARHEPPWSMALRVAALLPTPLSEDLVAGAEDFCRWRYHDLVVPGLVRRLHGLRFPKLSHSKRAA